MKPRRNREYEGDYSCSSRSGGREQRYEGGEVTSPEKRHRAGMRDVQGSSAPAGKGPIQNRIGTYKRRPRHESHVDPAVYPKVPQGTKNRKRGTK